MYHFLHGTAVVAQYSRPFLSRTCSAFPGSFNSLMMPEGIKDDITGRWQRWALNRPGLLQNNFLLNTNIECLVREDNAVDHHHFIFNSNSFTWIKEKSTEIVQRNNVPKKWKWTGMGK
ncbi:hypothetical protein SADUNF_Sadunf15G0062300 [Salix dunnii]|uniref:Uncharacterized protein n=1 Tax=Salix dunnii TaxID=1413687 RepID=A0A835JDS5_9ROSI|nr:hypothetical protein SADUNF_Sadunf15G0062300 [Salix dunnii]